MQSCLCIHTSLNADGPCWDTFRLSLINMADEKRPEYLRTEHMAELDHEEEGAVAGIPPIVPKRPKPRLLLYCSSRLSALWRCSPKSIPTLLDSCYNSILCGTAKG